MAPLATVDGVPIIGQPRLHGGVGVAGPRSPRWERPAHSSSSRRAAFPRRTRHRTGLRRSERVRLAVAEVVAARGCPVEPGRGPTPRLDPGRRGVPWSRRWKRSSTRGRTIATNRSPCRRSWSSSSATRPSPSAASSRWPSGAGASGSTSSGWLPRSSNPGGLSHLCRHPLARGVRSRLRPRRGPRHPGRHRDGRRRGRPRVRPFDRAGRRPRCAQRGRVRPPALHRLPRDGRVRGPRRPARGRRRALEPEPLDPHRPARGRTGAQGGPLRAAVGHSAGHLHQIDLRVDGPHALVGGTTGAGKSELLQSWILSMAANHSPQRLTFLLVDYKGGSAFAECNKPAAHRRHGHRPQPQRCPAGVEVPGGRACATASTSSRRPRPRT